MSDVEGYIVDDGIVWDINAQLIGMELAVMYGVEHGDAILSVLHSIRKNGGEFSDASLRSELNKQKILTHKAKTKYNFYVYFDFIIDCDIKILEVSLKNLQDKEWFRNKVIETATGLSAKSVSDFIVTYDALPVIEFSLSSTSYKAAYKRFYEVFTLVKGIFEFSYGARTIKRQFGETPRRLFCKFNHPPFILALFGNRQAIYTYDEVFLNTPKLIKRIADRQSTAQGLLGLFQNENADRSAYMVLENSLRLYDAAVSHPYRASSFLFYWNLLEELTVSGVYNGKTEKVLERAIKLAKTSAAVKYPNLFQHLKNLRNDVVHRGLIDLVEENHVVLIKHVVDMALENFIKVVEKFEKREQLNDYMELLTKLDEVDSLRRSLPDIDLK